MRIIIDIPEEEYKRMKEQSMFGRVDIWKQAIKNGTPLPKGHGRLIDADEVIKTMNCYWLDINKTHAEKYAMSVAKMMVRMESTIIEADRSEKT